MRIQIIPLRRMPFSLPYLDYLPGEFENNILPGQLVSVPFRNRQEYGIVRQLNDTSTISEGKLKKISSLLTQEPLLPPWIIEFCVEISEFYRTPIGFVLKSAILPLKKSKFNKIGNKLIVLDAYKPNQQLKPLLVNYHNLESRNKIISKLSGEHGQTLILVPELKDIEPTKQIVEANIDKKIISITGETGEKDLFEFWLNIRSDENIVVVGTRRALFMPWIALKNIIIDDEANPDYKSWDMSPRFHSRDAALMLAKYCGSKLYLMSPAPSVESYYFAKQNVYDTAGQTEKIASPSPIFIDAAREMKSSKSGYIAQEIIDSIENSSSDTFIYVNRRGTSNAVICRDCGYIFSCSVCRRPMTYFENTNRLMCAFCKESAPLNSTCPSCGGPSYKMIAPGAEGIAKDLHRLFPKKRIVSVEKFDPKSIKEMRFPGAKIIVGTKFAWSALHWSRLENFVFADPDATLTMPEFRATEFLWQMIRQAQINLSDSAKLFIQTSKFDHHLFQGLYNPAIFYETELAERSAFSYPPYHYLTRLIYAGGPNAQREAVRIFKQLQSLTGQLGDVKINGPFSATPPILRGKYCWIIVLKFNYKNYKQRMKEVVVQIPEDWKIDPNPNNLLSIA